jgi:hypothetical protein
LAAAERAEPMIETSPHQRERLADISKCDEQRADQVQCKSAEKESSKQRGHDGFLLTIVGHKCAAIEYRRSNNLNHGTDVIV